MDFLQTLRGAPDRTLYRVIAGRRPTKRDFQSDAELGREPRGDQLHDRRQYEGVSMFDRLQDAERVTRRFALGPAIAELVIAANSREITVHKTRGPHTTASWATPPSCAGWSSRYTSARLSVHDHPDLEHEHAQPHR